MWLFVYSNSQTLLNNINVGCTGTPFKAAHTLARQIYTYLIFEKKLSDAFYCT
jgi:hypothetical protein